MRKAAGRVRLSFCPQKTVYGANVIVFEGILAFANKELLKVSLPDVAGGPSRCVAWEMCGGVLWVGWVLSWPSPRCCWSRVMAGGCGGGEVLHRLFSEHLCVRGFRGGSAGCCCCGDQSWLGCMRGERGRSDRGLHRGCSPLPVFQLLDMKVFVDTDSDIRLVRRLQRDIMERGRDIVGVIKQYNKFVKPAFEQYIEPTVQVADIVVPRGEAALCLPDSA